MSTQPLSTTPNPAQPTYGTKEGDTVEKTKQIYGCNPCRDDPAWKTLHPLHRISISCLACVLVLAIAAIAYQVILAIAHA